MKKANLLFLLVVTLYACKQSGQHKMTYPITSRIEFRLPADTVSLPERIASIDYLLLSTPDEAYIYEADKIMFDDNHIYLADFRGHKIVVYNAEGEYVYTLDKKGSGPGEYLELRNFTTDGKHLYIIDNYRHKVFIYGCEDGTFVETKELPIVADDITYLTEGKFLLGLMPMFERNIPHSNHLLFIVNADFKITNRLLPYEGDKRIPFAPLSFFTSDEDNVYFSSLFFDGFTVIPRERPDSLYHIAIDFEKRIPEEIRSDGAEIDKGNYQYLYSTPVCCGDYYSFQIYSDNFLWTYVYDKRQKRLMTNSETNRNWGLYYPTASHRGKYITYLADADLYRELLKMGFPKADEAIEEKLENEGAVLIIYTMKPS